MEQDKRRQLQDLLERAMRTLQAEEGEASQLVEVSYLLAQTQSLLRYTLDRELLLSSRGRSVKGTAVADRHAPAPAMMEAARSVRKDGQGMQTESSEVLEQGSVARVSPIVEVDKVCESVEMVDGGSIDENPSHDGAPGNVSVAHPPQDPSLEAPAQMPTEPRQSPTILAQSYQRTHVRHETFLAKEATQRSYGQGQRLVRLGKGLTINDRTRFIRELFKGDAALFKLAVERIDGADNLSDALSALHEIYTGDMENPVLDDFVALVDRCFQ